MPTIIVHGGAGSDKSNKNRVKMIKKAVTLGYSVLNSGGSSIDAVIKSVMIMENSSEFNAGYGSYPTLSGDIEMDAALMDSNRNCGAVALLSDVKNPIKLAKKVMYETDHVFIAGKGAEFLARKWNFKSTNMLAPKRKKLYEKAIKNLKNGKNPSKYYNKSSKFIEYFGTVGAVAIDETGMIASATSTGGIFLKLPGRIGDTPLIGCGTYANEFGGCSATGHGESIIRMTLARDVVRKMENSDAQIAVDNIMNISSELGLKCGVIAINKIGEPAFGYTTSGMSWAYIKNGELKCYA
jgi:beta-aspartyl-peptidase (threonine type)